MLTKVPQFVRLEQTLDKYTLAIRAIDRESRIKVQPGAFRLSRNVCWPKAGLPHAARRNATRGHMVPMRLTNTPLWLYFRSVRSSEKSVKL